VSFTRDTDAPLHGMTAFRGWGIFWLVVSIIGAAVYFQTGAVALVEGWGTPEYSYGPLVPVLSAYMFLRQLRDMPADTGPATDRGPGIAVLALALLLGGVGRMVQISDLVAYAIILWVAGTVLICFGWRVGKQFWPPVLHLVFMLPLPGVLYYGLSTYLQGVSSHLGVYFLELVRVPVFLDGNVIDLGVYKLQVAEACSGLRYLFPILSFSYFFSTLYRGPFWHKLVLLLAAGPITVLMNSIRIAIAGVVVNQYGTAFVEGLSHFLEGWVIFVVCILLLFLLTWVLLSLQRPRQTLVQALDLDMDGIWRQTGRIKKLGPSSALIGAAVVVALAAMTWQVIPPRPLAVVEREPFALFPRELGEWTAGPAQRLDPETAKVLAADDYYATRLTGSSGPVPVDLFMAWYNDQLEGGTHSPTDCLPAGGWEIAGLEEVNVTPAGTAAPFTLNRALIRKGLEQMVVYYWYEQQGERTPSSYYSRLLLTWSKVTEGRSDGALVRLVTPILEGEDMAAAEIRLQSALSGVMGPLPRFVPGA
jgi:exosortase D (VPLPA-CTERM-specific)